MRQLWPHTSDDGMSAVADDLVTRSEWCALNFVHALDGAIVVDGRAGPLGGEGDHALFHALRDLSDVVLVGAGTARVENYGPTSLRAAEARGARGQADRPTLVLVTRSGHVDDLERLWAEPEAPVVVATGAGLAEERRAEIEALGAEVLVTDGPDGGPDLAGVVDALKTRGLGRILCEGGPGLAADMLDAGLVTDAFVTVAPLLVGGRTMLGHPLAAPVPLELAAVRHLGDELFLHHRVVED